MSLKKIGLLPRILIAIVLGILCGLFFPLWLTQVFITFNGIFGNQTFGITSGTSECERPADFASNERIQKYVADNMDQLAADIAVATNLLRRSFREAARGRRAAERSAALAAADDALDAAEAEALGPELAGALRALRAEERDALLLHVWAGLTYEQVARATGVAVGTVRSRIHRARLSVRAQLAAHDQGDLP